MTTISIRPIGQESPVITGELVHETGSYWHIRLAPNTNFNLFSKDDWELVPVPVPVPFVFPTAFGARITGVDKHGTLRFIIDGVGDWQEVNGSTWTEEELLTYFTDLRVVEADPDWGGE